MIKEKLIIIFEKNSGKIIGSLIGLILAIFILKIGLFKTLFIVAFIIVGYFIGDRVDKKESLLQLINKILRLGKGNRGI